MPGTDDAADPLAALRAAATALADALERLDGAVRNSRNVRRFAVARGFIADHYRTPFTESVQMSRYRGRKGSNESPSSVLTGHNKLLLWSRHARDTHTNPAHRAHPRGGG